jgi:predicted RNase H-like HicB family nuclease
MQVVTLIHEEDGVFGASFPDFLGCTTVAHDLDAVIAKAAEALAFHVEAMAEDGLALPQVRTLAQLRRDPTFRADSTGAMIALVPYAPPARAVRLNITLDESLLARIDRAAEAGGETRSGYLAGAARRRLAAETDAADIAPRALQESGRNYEPGRPTRRRKSGRARPSGSERSKRKRS